MQHSRVFGTVISSVISAAAMPKRPPQLLAESLRRQTLAWVVPLALMSIALASGLVYGVHQRQSAQVRTMAQRFGDEIAADLHLRQHGLRAVIAAATLFSTHGGHWVSRWTCCPICRAPPHQGGLSENCRCWGGAGLVQPAQTHRLWYPKHGRASQCAQRLTGGMAWAG
ncbi:MAG: hypothetical protein RI949_2656 [Pseudomonadota bacterium]